MKNYIHLNIKYLCEQNNLHYNEFAEIVDAGRSVVSMWIAQKSSPKIEAIQKICAHFDITIDDFINKDLRDLDYKAGKTPVPYDMEAMRRGWIEANEAAGIYMPNIETLKKQIEEKNKMIELQDKYIEQLEKAAPKGEKDKTKRQAG